MFNYLIQQPILKLLLVINVLFAVYASFTYGFYFNNALDELFNIFVNKWNLCFVFIIISLVAIVITTTLKKMTVVKIRMKRKKEELSYIAKYVGIYTFLFLLLFGIIQVLVVLCTHDINIGTGYYHFYGIPLFYFIFYMFRFFILLILYAILISAIVYLFPKWIVMLIVCILPFLLYIYEYDLNTVINSFSKMKWFIGYYFSLVPYDNFFTEIFYSLFYIILMSLLYLCLQSLIEKSKRNLFPLKLIIVNDFKSLIREKRKFLLSIFFIILAFLLFRIASGFFFSLKQVYMILGLKIDAYTDVLTICLFLIYIFTFTYLGFYLFIKDVNYQISNYFLRMKLSTWYIYKTISFCFIIIVIKFIYYFLFSCILNTIVKMDYHIYIYFFYDFLFTFFIEQSFLLLYFMDWKRKFIFLVIVISILSTVGISIMDFNQNCTVIGIGLCLEIISLISTCNNRNYLFFERRIKE